MRNDMKKVLTERPRHGHSKCYGEVRAKETRRDLDDLPRCQGMRAPYVHHYGENAKEFSDLLGPLRRFLFSCIGRKWDDVWSDVCAQLSNNTCDSHLKGHAQQMIETQTILIDGEVYTRSRWDGYKIVRGLYVHPETGIVCWAEYAPRHAKTAPTIYRDGFAYVEDDHGVLNSVGWRKSSYARKLIGFEKEAIKIDGIWYWVVFATVVPPTRSDDPRYWVPIHPTDFLTGRVVREGRYRADKRQMAARDLRRYRLTNDR